MKVVTIILGVLLVLCGISCMCTPLATFMGMEYLLLTLTAVAMLIYGILGIVGAVQSKEYGVNFLFGIMSVIAGALMFIPGMRMVAGGMALFVAAAWFILKGFTTVFLALNAKKVYKQSKMWIWGLVIGIIGIILGIFSFIHPAVLAVSMGILVSIYMMETGINMIVIAAQS